MVPIEYLFPQWGKFVDSVRIVHKNAKFLPSGDAHFWRVDLCEEILAEVAQIAL